MNSPDLSRLTPQAVKAYHQGLAIAQRKLAACHVPTAAEREAESIRRGTAEIVKRFGSKVAKSRFGIASPSHVDSPEERIDRIATAAAGRVVKAFTAATVKPTPKPSKAPTPAPSTARAKYHAGRTVKYLCSGGGLFGRTA